MEEQDVENAFHIANLIIKHLKGEASAQDLSELHHWINSHTQHYELFESLKNAAASTDALNTLRSFSAGEAWLRFIRKPSGQ